MKQYFFANEEQPSQGWSVSMIHATPFRTKEDAEAAIVKFALKDRVRLPGVQRLLVCV